MDRLMGLLRPTAGTMRDLLAIVSAGVAVIGVGILWGLGAALLVGGLAGLALVAAWSLITVAEGRK